MKDCLGVHIYYLQPNVSGVHGTIYVVQELDLASEAELRPE